MQQDIVTTCASSSKSISNQSFKEIKPILTKNYIQSAVRPKYSSLNIKKFTETFGIDACDWKAEVNKILEEKSYEFKL